jgi:sigma-B regulation protein RsbU (phosphoserine phosphatase)
MAHLREIGGAGIYLLRGSKILVGRAPECDIVLTSRKVSARHAILLHGSEGWSIEDLGSSNGTFVNGRRVTGRILLQPGDRLEFFGTTLEYQPQDNPDLHRPVFTLVEPKDPGGASVVSALHVDDTVRIHIAPEAKLRAVLEFSRSLGRTLDLREVLPRILDSLFVIFPQADRGFIVLRDPVSGRLLPKAVKHRCGDPESPPAISRTIIDYTLQSGKAVLSADAGHDARFDKSQSIRQHQIRSIMCAPLLDQENRAIGVIQLDTRSLKAPFDEDDLDVLVVAAIQASRAVALARLHSERRDLEAAMQIQKSFLPSERPLIPGWRFYDYYASAQQIGGDYFDYIPLPGDRLAVTIGDVAGKGIPAALLMARLSAEVRYTLASEIQLAEAANRLNRALKRACGDDRFVTLLIVVIHLHDGSFTLVNAGHLPLLRRCPDNATEVVGEGSGGIPLGVLDRPYSESSGRLNDGEVLVLVTDGVIDVRGPDQQPYGLDRLRQILASAPADAQGVVEAILHDVETFRGDRALPDDLTLVAVSRNGVLKPTA